MSLFNVKIVYFFEQKWPHLTAKLKGSLKNIFIISFHFCLSGMPVLLLMFILYIDLGKCWIQSVPIYLCSPHGTFDSSICIYFVLMLRCNFFKSRKDIISVIRNHSIVTDPFLLFNLFSSISITFEYFVRCRSQLT